MAPSHVFALKLTCIVGFDEDQVRVDHISHRPGKAMSAPETLGQAKSKVKFEFKLRQEESAP
ncbi:hypothetical protein PSm6_52050 [Pseudomonas solani]|uniref:Uncharacterized protein n=1 Tax=Pseudomonas solani TaxID=2731552 RepID=A0ABN6BYD8_9PSED|nr:hypothetical protein PSm6_52050 [Pseudomonas solani]